ncbi:hypothetical protein [Rhodoplanes azumiensis]|uniref:Uncharacterized protein n=1 Tax=Rhodoplanes azumiensis TaxID=1897628 RepID=A0ABW5AM15_9BRAD
MAGYGNPKNYLKLSLVSCAARHPSGSTARCGRFDILSKTTGRRVRNAVVDSETDAPAPADDPGKDGRLVDGFHVGLGHDEFDRIARGRTHRLDFDPVVPADPFGPVDVATPYDLVPDHGIDRGPCGGPRRPGGRDGRRPRPVVGRPAIGVTRAIGAVAVGTVRDGVLRSVGRTAARPHRHRPHRDERARSVSALVVEADPWADIGTVTQTRPKA